MSAKTCGAGPTGQSISILIDAAHDKASGCPEKSPARKANFASSFKPILPVQPCGKK
jgi:hypothetical protein